MLFRSADGPDAFAHAVVRVLRDSALRQQMGKDARAAVCARFGWESATSAFARVCERVVRGLDVKAQRAGAVAARAGSV